MATFEPLADDLYAAIAMLRRRAARSSGNPWEPRMLTGAQIELLKLIRRNPLISVASAATELGLAANTISTLVRQLVTEELLERVRDDEDRRVVRLRLTPAADVTLRRWSDVRSAATAAAIESLPKAQQEALARAVPALTALADAVIK